MEDRGAGRLRAAAVPVVLLVVLTGVGACGGSAGQRTLQGHRTSQCGNPSAPGGQPNQNSPEMGPGGGPPAAPPVLLDRGRDHDGCNYADYVYEEQSDGALCLAREDGAGGGVSACNSGALVPGLTDARVMMSILVRDRKNCQDQQEDGDPRPTGACEYALVGVTGSDVSRLRVTLGPHRLLDIPVHPVNAPSIGDGVGGSFASPFEPVSMRRFFTVVGYSATGPRLWTVLGNGCRVGAPAGAC